MCAYTYSRAKTETERERERARERESDICALLLQPAWMGKTHSSICLKAT